MSGDTPTPALNDPRTIERATLLSALAALLSSPSTLVVECRHELEAIVAELTARHQAEGLTP